MNKHKTLILTIILLVVVYFTYFHEKVALSYQISSDRVNIEEYNVRIIHETKPKTIKDKIKYIFKSKWKLAYAVMMSEGGLNKDAIHRNTDKEKTLDRGLFQINSKWHNEVSDECAFNIDCNIKEAYRISKGGTDWHEWYGYKNGSYKIQLLQLN